MATVFFYKLLISFLYRPSIHTCIHVRLIHVHVVLQLQGVVTPIAL